MKRTDAEELFIGLAIVHLSLPSTVRVKAVHAKFRVEDRVHLEGWVEFESYARYTNCFTLDVPGIMTETIQA